MNVPHTRGFERSFIKLPKEIKRLFLMQEKRFKDNWRDPRLHAKKLIGVDNVFSFRVTRNWRVLFYFQDPITAIFFVIDNRKDIYR